MNYCVYFSVGNGGYRKVKKQTLAETIALPEQPLASIQGMF